MSDIEKKIKGLERLVIINTENQVVNYFPIKLKEWKKIYSLVVQSGMKKISSAIMEESLRKVINTKITPINIDRNIIGNIDRIISKIQDIINSDEEYSILWSITGGQRFMLMAIIKIINESKDKKRENDKLIYFDGNENKFYLYDKDFRMKEYDNNIEVSLPESLSLIGINHNEKLKELMLWRNEERESTNGVEKEIILKLSERMNNEENLRKEIINLNLGKSEERKKRKIQLLLKSYFSENDEILDFIKESYEKNSYLIGNLFEKIVFYELIHFLESAEGEKYCKKIEGVYYDYSYRENKEKIDQIDVLIALKSGRIIVIECKTGNMSADNAKSNKSTTYAISGVYGVPILVVPLKEKYDDKKFPNIEKAINAARKNKLEIYYLDNIKKIVEEYIN